MPVERKACFHVANALLNRLELILPITTLKSSKMSRNGFFWQSVLGVNGYRMYTLLLQALHAYTPRAYLHSLQNEATRNTFIVHVYFLLCSKWNLVILTKQTKDYPLQLNC